MIEPETKIGAVALRVNDVETAQDFYQRVIGLEALDGTKARPDAATQVLLGAPGADRPLIKLIPSPGAPPRPRPSTGLFHLAILVPDREQLGVALHRIAAAGWRLSGASDHLVSEALYLGDPDGNGIEIYRDRPREEWRQDANGDLMMDTLSLDIQEVFAEGEAAPTAPLAAETVIGHVHLNAADLDEAERYYAGALGLDVTVRTYPGALFLSAGGYHHHLGLNTWAGAGAPPPPEGSLGLDHFELDLPSPEAVEAAASRLKQAGFAAQDDPTGITVSRDPSGINVRLRPD